jgi:hypothetical protein
VPTVAEVCRRSGVSPDRIEIDLPLDELAMDVGPGAVKKTRLEGKERLRLSDVASYRRLQEHVSEEIIWPEKYRWNLVPDARSSGILFFGPPGCGKSRLARAIAGELDQEVWLLGPADLRGPYIGWAQIMIREQFDWVTEDERRMLVIDELDAMAHSRRDPGGGIHTDEQAKELRKSYRAGNAAAVAEVERFERSPEHVPTWSTRVSPSSATARSIAPCCVAMRIWPAS